MPVSGFKPGDAVLTPSGRRATVVSVTPPPGPEYVIVRYDEGPFNNRRFRANALRYATKR